MGGVSRDHSAPPPNRVAGGGFPLLFNEEFSPFCSGAVCEPCAIYSALYLFAGEGGREGGGGIIPPVLASTTPFTDEGGERFPAYLVGG